MHENRQDYRLEKSISLVTRGSQLLELNIWSRMSREPGRLFCVNEFLYLNKNKDLIRKTLRKMIKKKNIKVHRGIPNFYFVEKDSVRSFNGKISGFQ